MTTRQTVRHVSNGHAIITEYYIPGVPTNYDDLAAAALAMPYGIAQFNALMALRNGRSGHYVAAGHRRGAVHQFVSDTMRKVGSRLKDYSDFAWYCALHLTPNYIQAVKEYNSGLNPSQPWFTGLFAQMNNYYKQGQAARGRLTPEAGQAALRQWLQDMKPGSFENIMDTVTMAVGVALAAYMGGALAGEFIGAGASSAGSLIGQKAIQSMNAPDIPQMSAPSSTPAQTTAAPPPAPGVVPPVKPGVSSPGKKKVPFRYSCSRGCCSLSLLERIYKWMPLSTTQNAVFQA